MHYVRSRKYPYSLYPSHNFQQGGIGVVVVVGGGGVIQKNIFWNCTIYRAIKIKNWTVSFFKFKYCQLAALILVKVKSRYTLMTWKQKLGLEMCSWDVYPPSQQPRLMTMLCLPSGFGTGWVKSTAGLNMEMVQWWVYNYHSVRDKSEKKVFSGTWNTYLMNN